MWDDREVTLKNFYGMKIEEDPNRMEKVKAVIEQMGDKYCLAKPVERKING